MSYNVLVIPEDFVKDEGILKPIITAMLAEVGKPRANVRVCNNPRLKGTGQALSKERIAEVVRLYPGVDLFLLCVDRDGVETRRQRLDNIETHVATACRKTLLAENAWQEVEVWVLAGLTNLPPEWSWREIRSEVSLKERYFAEVSRREGLEQEPDQGRAKLARVAASRISRIRRLCPEDLEALQARIQGAVGG